MAGPAAGGAGRDASPLPSTSSMRAYRPTIPASGAAARDSPVVVCDLIACLLRSERSCEFVCAVLDRCVERMVEPEAEEPALGRGDRAGMRRGAVKQPFGGFGEKAGLGDDVG